ncbi:circularly permuted type 2 ATP-grasp protein [Georgenia sp. SYP-B2076]|uniref:circularly permuted type 2 ATP-grasp protein n=1 Tax=Georgenia sp. SYP-B2076 TaxID=2495881 RepID=UPI0013DEAD68|nr:circularly permuted type 2 ATP-grasp protein [Georgenia sp. SYP-B2076]
MVDLLTSYRANGPGHDEMLQATGPARAAWEQLAEQARLGQGARLDASRAEVVRLLQDQGLPQAGPAAEAWQLDPLPVLVDELEWHPLEAALRQRAELLDQILTDLYGERKLLASGLLPPEIVLGHPGFVREAAGIRIPGAHQLFHSAVDLARNADGAWTALADRSDSPVGLGYVMADRRVVSEVLAGSYRTSRTRRVGPFFQALRESLQAAAPAPAGDSPRIAVLTPGESSPSTFDHGYLATMLGLPLVEGGDLVVEDGRVWARSLGRREPVDVLLRRVAATQVDPLELDGTSRLGTPGLVHAARTGGVTIVNTLGSGVLESPALLTYLPRLARALRDEELALPSAVTYWCGERSMCSHVIANLGRLVIRSTTSGHPPVAGWELTMDERADLAAAIAARPSAWVGQEPVEASTTPTVLGRSLVPQPTSLRTFAVAHGEGYVVMSGALGSVGPAPQAALAGPTMGGTAKDVWVLAAEPRAVADRALPTLDLPPARSADAAISPRAAEDLFRLGRSTERAEATVRLLAAVADRWDDYHSRPTAPATAPAGTDPAGTDPAGNHPAPPGHGHAAGTRALDVLLGALHELADDAPLPSLVTDESVTGSVAWSVAQMSRDAAGVRDNLSPDVWLAISSLERTLALERARRHDGDGAQLGLGPVLSRLLESLMALHGIFTESLVRDIGWRLLEVGRRLERARHLVTALGASVSVRRERAVESLVIESVLLAHESVITFRRRYPTGGLGAMLDLLLTDETNPRALAFQLAQLRTHLAELPALARGPASRDQLLAEVTDLLAELRTDRVEGVGGRRVQLAQTLESIHWRLDELGTEIIRVHFTHPVAARWPEEGWQQ